MDFWRVVNIANAKTIKCVAFIATGNTYSPIVVLKKYSANIRGQQ